MLVNHEKQTQNKNEVGAGIPCRVGLAELPAE